MNTFINIFFTIFKFLKKILVVIRAHHLPHFFKKLNFQTCSQANYFQFYTQKIEFQKNFENMMANGATLTPKFRPRGYLVGKINNWFSNYIVQPNDCMANLEFFFFRNSSKVVFGACVFEIVLWEVIGFWFVQSYFFNFHG